MHAAHAVVVAVAVVAEVDGPPRLVAVEDEARCVDVGLVDDDVDCKDL